MILAELLESTYGIEIYWPSRTNLPSHLPGNVFCLCGAPDANCRDNIPVWPDNWEIADAYNAQFKEWRLKEMITLGMALIMYRDEMGLNASRAAFEGVLLVRVDKDPLGLDTFLKKSAGQYWDTGYGGFGQPSIFFFDAGASQSYSGQTWTFTHELAHRLADFITIQGFQDVELDFRDEIWSGSNVNPGTGPTFYASDPTFRIGEDIAESITVYLWDQYSSQFDRGTSSPVPLLAKRYRNHDSLDIDRNDFIEELFDLLRVTYP